MQHFPNSSDLFLQGHSSPTEQSLVDTILGKYCGDAHFTSAPSGGPRKPSLAVALACIVVGSL